MYCQNHHKLDGSRCIEDQELKLAAYYSLRDFEQSLKRERGQYMLGRQADYRLPRENLTSAVKEKAAYYGADEASIRSVVYDFLNEDIKV